MRIVESYCNQHGINIDSVVMDYVDQFNPRVWRIDLRNGECHIFDSLTLMRLN